MSGFVGYIKDRKPRTVPDYIIVYGAVLLFVLFVAPMFSGILNEGNKFGAAFAFGAAIAWKFYPLIRRNKVLSVVFWIITAIVGLCVAWALYLSVNMIAAMHDNPDGESADYTVIVLGCRVTGDRPSTMLVRRLTAAYDFLEQNEAAACVTTGGIGEGNTYSEGEVGRNWLINRAIDESRLFAENASVNTADNLAFAHEIIAREGLPQNVIIVSDGFHLWRAKLLAEKLFDGDVKVLPAKTSPMLVPTYWVREWFALTRDFVNPELFR